MKACLREFFIAIRPKNKSYVHLHIRLACQQKIILIISTWENGVEGMV
jgi:murein endopeptidase